jgi:hypothetical protein
MIGNYPSRLSGGIAMRKAASYIIIFGLCLVLVGVSTAKEEEEFPVPVEFKSIDMQDIGNFHGDKASSEQTGWYFWGGREPIVSPGWVVFPVTGVYRFVVECKSNQFDPGDTAKGIFAEFDVRLHILDGNNDAGKIKRLIENISSVGGNPVVAHGSASADAQAGEDWKKVTVTTADPTTGEPLEIEEGTKAQVEIWFTNDEWDDPKDRNLYVRSVAVLLPEGVKIAVEPVSKLAATWGEMKAK